MKTEMPPHSEVAEKSQETLRVLQKTERYARSCKHCTDTADSFGRYVSTYCHLKQQHIAIHENDELEECKVCKLYEKKEQRK